MTTKKEPYHRYLEKTTLSTMILDFSRIVFTTSGKASSTPYHSGFSYEVELSRAEPSRFYCSLNSKRPASLPKRRGVWGRRFGYRLTQPRPSHPLVKYQRRDRQWEKSWRRLENTRRGHSELIYAVLYEAVCYLCYITDLAQKIHAVPGNWKIWKPSH